ncbi:MAG: L-alanine-DL-glutamate epimerase-like enolase superfamily enzyme, partial [Gammaproteobacteria bacterium]
CPRSYVTGETQASAINFFATHQKDFKLLTSLTELREWITGHEADIDRNPAAFCAVENALLNLYTASAGSSLESLLELKELSGTFNYTAVLGARGESAFTQQLEQYKQLSMTQFKIKLFADMETDQRNLNTFSAIIKKPKSIRFDANNCWETSSQAIDYLQRLTQPTMGIEEPLKAFDYAGCREIAAALKCRIILDESFLRLEHFSSIKFDPENWIINLRVSKMGGILRSLQIVERARQLSIPIIIGAQVGETSLLSRSALCIANTSKDILLGQEGALGLYLLQHDLLDPPIMFGPHGVIRAEQISA